MIYHVKPVLTDYAVSYIQDVAQCFLSKDFFGYILDIGSKRKVSMFVPIKGDFFLLGAKKPITERKYRKLLRYLDKIGFIREGYNDPFSECQSYNNLVPPDDVIIVDDNLIEEV